MYEFPKAEATAVEALAAEVEPTCGENPPGYDFVSCDRPVGHEGRHWCQVLNWPAA
jgi:hypothetical protein